MSTDTMNSNDVVLDGRSFLTRCFNSLSMVTFIVATIAVVLGLDQGASAIMSYDRDAISQGEFWRWATGHLTHWNADHLIWDVLMFVVLSCIVEQRGRQIAMGLLIASAMLISISLWHWSSGVHEYRGLSGVDSALFSYVAVVLAREGMAAKRYRQAMLMVLLLVGFVGKVSFELVTGATLFVDSHSAGFTPLPFVHIVGAATGFLFAASNPCAESDITSGKTPEHRSELELASRDVYSRVGGSTASTFSLQERAGDVFVDLTSQAPVRRKFSS